MTYLSDIDFRHIDCSDVSLLRAYVHPSMTRAQARAELFKSGWQFVGGGSFASVWKQGERVVKVTKPDAGAEAVYRLAQAHPDCAAFPRYFGRVELADGGVAYEVEALEEMLPYDEQHDVAYAIAYNGAAWCRGKAREQRPVAPCSAELLAAETAHVAEACRLIHAHAVESGGEPWEGKGNDEWQAGMVAWDIHSGNVMFRGHQLVWTDPLYEPVRMGQSSWQGGTKHDAASVAKAA